MDIVFRFIDTVISYCFTPDLFAHGFQTKTKNSGLILSVLQ